jgi:hypothetical protein
MRWGVIRHLLRAGKRRRERPGGMCPCFVAGRTLPFTLEPTDLASPLVTPTGIEPVFQP